MARSRSSVFVSRSLLVLGLGLAAGWSADSKAQTFSRRFQAAEVSTSTRQLLPTFDGRYVCVGESSGSSGVSAQAMVTDFLGNVEWCHDFATPVGSTFAGCWDAEGSSVFVVGSSGLSPWVVELDDVTGITRSSHQFTIAGSYRSVEFARTSAISVYAIGDSFSFSGDSYALVSRLNLDGTARWHRVLQDESGTLHGYGGSPTSDGGVLVVARRGTPGIDVLRPVLVSLDADGEIRWSEQFEAYSVDVTHLAVAPMMGGDVVFAASDGATLWLTRVNEFGVEVWERVIHGMALAPVAIDGTYHGDCIVSASVMDPNGAETHAWVGKLSAEGELEWQNEYGIGSVCRLESVQEVDGGYVAVGSRDLESGTSATWMVHADAHGLITDDCAEVRPTHLEAFSAVTLQSSIELTALDYSTNRSSPAITVLTRSVEAEDDCADRSMIRVTRFGEGTEGSGGFVPDLGGHDGFCRGASAGIHLQDAVGGALSLAWISAGLDPIPGFGGTFQLDLGLAASVPLVLEGADGSPGNGHLYIPVGGALPGLNQGPIYLQFMILDPAAPRRVVLSSALELRKEED